MAKLNKPLGGELNCVQWRYVAVLEWKCGQEVNMSLGGSLF